MKVVYFNDFNSYEDFSLILSNKTIGNAETKTSIVEIEGMDGQLDLTDYFGEPKYKNRKLSFEFSTIVPMNEFLDLYSEIQNNLHGQIMNIKLEDDPDFYYVGRVSVNEWKTDKRIGKVVLDVDAEPYKYKNNDTVITEVISGTKNLNLSNLRKSVVPTFTSTGELNIQFEDVTYSINAGEHVIDDIVLKAGINRFVITGNASLTIKYREGGL